MGAHDGPAGYALTMPNPQQPELRRSGLGATSDDSAKINADHESKTTASGLPDKAVPEANQPGHHPDHDQDKPSPDRLPDAPPADGG
jgi:hypothetical protein